MIPGQTWQVVVLTWLALAAASYAAGFIAAAIQDGRVPEWLRQRLDRWAHELIWKGLARSPDLIIGSGANPYLLRWWLAGSRPHPTKPGVLISKKVLGFRPYLHCFKRSDDDRALHDHPSPSLSIMLRGRATEHTIEAGGIHRRQQLQAGSIRFRRATFAHRIEIEPHSECWTLFIFLPTTRDWGFHCPKRGWVPWQEFTDPTNSGLVGPGCGE